MPASTGRTPTVNGGLDLDPVPSGLELDPADEHAVVAVLEGDRVTVDLDPTRPAALDEHGVVAPG